MSIELIYKIKENNDYLNYLHHNSLWYKYLNRSDKYFKDFEKEVKDMQRQNLQDRIKNALDTIEMFENVISTLK